MGGFAQRDVSPCIAQNCRIRPRSPWSVLVSGGVHSLYVCEDNVNSFPEVGDSVCEYPGQRLNVREAPLVDVGIAVLGEIFPAWLYKITLYWELQGDPSR